MTTQVDVALTVLELGDYLVQWKVRDPPELAFKGRERSLGRRREEVRRVAVVEEAESAKLLA